jgi:hypothetical protein
VLCDETGKPLRQKVIQVLVRRTARRANVKAFDAAIRLLETGTESNRTAVEKQWRRRERRGGRKDSETKKWSAFALDRRRPSASAGQTSLVNETRWLA